MDIVHQEDVAEGYNFALPMVNLGGVHIFSQEADAGVATALQCREGHLHLVERILNRDIVLKQGKLGTVNTAINRQRTDVGAGNIEEERRVGKSLQVKFA